MADVVENIHFESYLERSIFLRETGGLKSTLKYLCFRLCPQQVIPPIALWRRIFGCNDVYMYFKSCQLMYRVMYDLPCLFS